MHGHVEQALGRGGRSMGCQNSTERPGAAGKPERLPKQSTQGPSAGAGVDSFEAGIEKFASKGKLQE